MFFNCILCLFTVISGELLVWALRNGPFPLNSISQLAFRSLCCQDLWLRIQMFPCLQIRAACIGKSTCASLHSYHMLGLYTYISIPPCLISQLPHSLNRFGIMCGRETKSWKTLSDCSKNAPGLRCLNLRKTSSFCLQMSCVFLLFMWNSIFFLPFYTPGMSHTNDVVVGFLYLLINGFHFWWGVFEMQLLFSVLIVIHKYCLWIL